MAAAKLRLRTLPRKARKAGSKPAKATRARRVTAQDPRSVGVDPKSVRGYEQAMADLVKRGVIPGCASVAIRQGKVFQVGEWGYADVEHRTKFRLDTLCRIFCTSKSYICVALGTLVDAGRISFDDPVEKFLPGFSNMLVQKKEGSFVKAKSPILLKHLLSHTSGISYPVDYMGGGEEPDGAFQKSYVALQEGVHKGTIRSLKAFVDRLAKLPLQHHPGEMYDYGYGFEVLARVLEVIDKKPLDKVLCDRVFGPLGMEDTIWEVPDKDLHRLAACYSKVATWGNLYGDTGRAPTTAGWNLCRIDSETPETSGWAAKRGRLQVLSGGGFMTYHAGGLLSTVNDTVKFVQMLINKGTAADGTRYLQEQTLAEMEKNRMKKSWGCGRVCYIGNIGVFREDGNEFGMGGAACTYWSVDRDNDIHTVWFTQHVDMPDFSEDIRGVDPAKADMWKTLHEGQLQGKRAGSGKLPAKKRLRW